MKNVSKSAIEMVVCDKAEIPAFQDLLFGKAKDGTTLFDATAYLNKHKGNLSIKNFQRLYNEQCITLARSCELDFFKSFRINADGHQLIDSHFAYLFLFYVDDMFLAYACERLDELFKIGFTTADSYVLGSALMRFSKDYIMKAYETKK